MPGSATTFGVEDVDALSGNSEIAEAVCKWWEDHHLVNYEFHDVGSDGYPRMRCCYVADAIAAILLIKNGKPVDTHDFGSEPPDWQNTPFYHEVRNRIVDYPRAIDERIKEAKDAAAKIIAANGGLLI